METSGPIVKTKKATMEEKAAESRRAMERGKTVNGFKGYLPNSGVTADVRGPETVLNPMATANRTPATAAAKAKTDSTP